MEDKTVGSPKAPEETRRLGIAAIRSACEGADLAQGLPWEKAFDAVYSVVSVQERSELANRIRIARELLGPDVFGDYEAKAKLVCRFLGGETEPAPELSDEQYMTGVDNTLRWARDYLCDFVGDRGLVVVAAVSTTSGSAVRVAVDKKIEKPGVAQALRLSFERLVDSVALGASENGQSSAPADELARTKSFVCSVCQLPMATTPSGLACPDGHGGSELEAGPGEVPARPRLEPIEGSWGDLVDEMVVTVPAGSISQNTPGGTEVTANLLGGEAPARETVGSILDHPKANLSAQSTREKLLEAIQRYADAWASSNHTPNYAINVRARQSDLFVAMDRHEFWLADQSKKVAEEIHGERDELLEHLRRIADAAGAGKSNLSRTESVDRIVEQLSDTRKENQP